MAITDKPLERQNLLAPIPFDKLWDCDLAVIEDQLYTDRALTDNTYAEALGYVLEAKRAEMKTPQT